MRVDISPANHTTPLQGPVMLVHRKTMVDQKVKGSCHFAGHILLNSVNLTG